MNGHDRRPPPGPFPRLGYRLGRGVAGAFFRLHLALGIEGAEHVPRSGGVLIAANHVSYLDPPLVGVAAPRECRFLAKRELFRLRPVGAFLRWWNAAPVDRSELEASVLRRVVEDLRAGRAVVVFPEGTRSRTGRLGRARPGVGLFARAAQVPVVPAAVVGSGRWWWGWWRGRRVRVRFGPALAPPASHAGRKELDAFVGGLMEELARLAGAEPAGRRAGGGPGR